MIHIAAVTQLRLNGAGRAYYRHERAAHKKPMEAMRCLKRRISDAIYRQLLVDAATPPALSVDRLILLQSAISWESVDSLEIS